MSSMVFILLLISAAAMDRSTAAGIVCVCAAGALMLMSKEMLTGRRHYIVFVLIIAQANGGMKHADRRADQGKDIPQGGGIQTLCQGKEMVKRKVRI